MARIRTLQRAIEELKKDDPNCDLTLSALRKKVILCEVPYTRCGTKYLVDVDIIKDAIFKHKEVASGGINRI
jgi:hypothetical protein